MISNLTEAVMEEVKTWQSRPLDGAYQEVLGLGAAQNEGAKFTASLVPLVEPLSKENMVGKELPRNSRRPTAAPGSRLQVTETMKPGRHVDEICCVPYFLTSMIRDPLD